MNFVQYILLVLNKIISNRFLYELFTVYLEKIILIYILKDTILLIYRISFNNWLYVMHNILSQFEN